LFLFIFLIAGVFHPFSTRGGKLIPQVKNYVRGYSFHPFFTRTDKVFTRFFTRADKRFTRFSPARTSFHPLFISWCCCRNICGPYFWNRVGGLML
jgi:hypothetical protein